MSFDIKTNVIMTTWGCVANNWLLPASEKKDSAGARQQVADLGIKPAVRMLVISGNKIGGVFVFVSLVDRQLHFGAPGRDEGRVSPHGKGGAMRGQLFVLLDIWSTVTVRGIATECACGGRYEEVAATNGSDGDRC